MGKSGYNAGAIRKIVQKYQNDDDDDDDDDVDDDDYDVCTNDKILLVQYNLFCSVL